MPKTKTKEETEVGEQMVLIDIAPTKAKPIMVEAKIYKRLMLARKKAGEKEVAQKARVLSLIRDAKIRPLEDGVIRFSYDGFTISVTPRDELVKVTEETE